MKAPALIRSGWWVAVAALVVSGAVVWIMVAPILSNRGPGIAPIEFDLGSATVDRDLIVRAMAIDGVRALSSPDTISPQEIDRYNSEERGKLLVPDDRVVGLFLGGEARAYPLRLMRWHEVVNDVVGGEVIAVTYSPLCDSVVVYSTQTANGVIELGVSGLLYNSNPLLYDRNKGPESSPLWTQLDGLPVTGGDPLQSNRLRPLTADLITWRDWRAQHPETTIVAQQPDMKKLYKRDPYHSYFGSDVLRFPVAPLPPETGLRLKDRVVVIAVDDTEAILALPFLGESPGTVEVVVADLPFRVVFDAEVGVAEVDPLIDTDRRISVRYSFWFAWYSLKRTIPDNIHATVSDDTIFGSVPTTVQSPGGA